MQQSHLRGWAAFISKKTIERPLSQSPRNSSRRPWRAPGARSVEEPQMEPSGDPSSNTSVIAVDFVEIRSN
jgi:hypothetical protein